MPISNFTTDYTGRKKDISIAYGINPKSDARQTVILQFGKISSYCAGIQKLVQRYMVYFMTMLGTQNSYPTFGTNFLKNVTQGNVKTREDLIHEFNFANLAVLSTFKDYQKIHPEMPIDEQISTASLSNISSSGGSVSLDIRIVSNAGDTVTFLMPLPLQRN